MSNIVKSKFVGLLRGLLRRYDDSDVSAVESPRSPAPVGEPPHVAPPPASYQHGSSQRASSHAAAPQSRPRPVFSPSPAAPAAGANVLQLPLPSIVAVLPMDLRAKLTQTPPANVTISVPVESVLSQLATGSVKMTFGELRAAQPGLFLHSGGENDARQITLPLKEIISRINPVLLSRRAGKKVDLADDIAGPFSNRAQAVESAPVHVPAKAAPVPPQKVSGPFSAPVVPIRIAPKPVVFPRNGATAPRPAPVAPVHAPPAADGLNFAPQIPVGDSILAPLAALAENWPDNIKQELVQANLTTAQAALPAVLIEPGLKSGRVTVSWKNLRPMILPNPAPVSVHDGVELELPLKVLAPLFLASRKAAGRLKPAVPVADEIPDLFFGSSRATETAAVPAPVLESAPAPAPVYSAPVATTVPAAPAAPEQKVIYAPLSALMEKWPEALRQEIAQWNLADVRVALPWDAVAPALKRGMVRFAWRDLRSWIRPVPAATSSVHDDMELELPLKVIAPLFLEQQASKGRPHLQHTLDESIPNFFFDIPSLGVEPRAAAPAAAHAPEAPRPAPKPMDVKLSETNFYVWGDSADTPRVDAAEFKRSPAPGTDFTSRYATPKEVMEHAMKVPGVAGAVIALYDGLLIASQVPPDLNADTVAAFLPQIFSRTSQSTKELRMGELNNLNFTVGNVPWIIFCVSSVYFAAFGPPGGALPVATLTELARRLDRKNK